MAADTCSDTPLKDTSASNNPFILVPLYIYPASNSWAPLISSVSKHPNQDFLVVVNPDNGPGPGDLPDTNYISVLKTLSLLPNVKLLGYVHCTYGQRPQEEIIPDITSYKNWHTITSGNICIDGIFFDETPSTPEYVEYMSFLSSQTRSILQDAIIIYNPGIFPQSVKYYDSADYIIPFENEADQWESEYVQINLVNLSDELKAKSIAIAHSCKEWNQQVGIVEEAIGKHGFAGHFVTGVGGYTEWCGLWEEYVRMTAARMQEGKPHSGEA
ncbi:Spherulin-4 [Podospora fimiseda]|uniref:Spherulin-4 n=1 Tax=Podospora fimiseda TaxID=252190 RepID=A0AAN7BHB0_9PEZI|nr:Spherulin-4 [Podospora fimiseda]